ncbi:MAG: uracil-DNA glycosylase [Pseudomonadota bacterium]
MTDRRRKLAALDWIVAMGADEAIGEEPIDRRNTARPTPEPAPAPEAEPVRASMPPPRDPGPDAPLAPAQGAADAREAAAAATDLDSLRAALEKFEGCALKQTATNLVFARGNPQAPVMFIGEAPGAEEDREGLPFVGASGKLLNRILSFIGLDEQSVYISNIIFWRPPGNRSPTDAETAACLPFVRRHIALVRPRLLVTLGRPAMNTVLGLNSGINKARGRWIEYGEGLETPIPAMPTFHPAYLLRNPAQKRETWMDFLSIRGKLDELT